MEIDKIVQEKKEKYVEKEGLDGEELDLQRDTKTTEYDEIIKM